MIGDRVRIGRTGIIMGDGEDMIFVYMPKYEDAAKKKFLTARDGTVIVDSLGGVKSGSTGTIQGHGIMVHRTMMMDHDKANPGLGLADEKIMFLPVFLDYYQQLGWFPVEYIKVI